MSGYTFLYTHA